MPGRNFTSFRLRRSQQVSHYHRFPRHTQGATPKGAWGLPKKTNCRDSPFLRTDLIRIPHPHPFVLLFSSFISSCGGESNKALFFEGFTGTTVRGQRHSRTERQHPSFAPGASLVMSRDAVVMSCCFPAGVLRQRKQEGQNFCWVSLATGSGDPSDQDGFRCIQSPCQLNRQLSEAGVCVYTQTAGTQSHIPTSNNATSVSVTKPVICYQSFQKKKGGGGGFFL